MKSTGTGFKALMVNVMIRNLGEPSQYHPSSISEFKANWKLREPMTLSLLEIKADIGEHCLYFQFSKLSHN